MDENMNEIKQNVQNADLENVAGGLLLGGWYCTVCGRVFGENKDRAISHKEQLGHPFDYLPPIC